MGQARKLWLAQIRVQQWSGVKFWKVDEKSILQKKKKINSDSPVENFYKIADIQHNQETAIVRWKQKNKLSVCFFVFFFLISKYFFPESDFVRLVYFIFILFQGRFVAFC